MDLNKRLSSLQEISKAQLSKILNSVPHTKSIVLEPEIIRPLERVCGVKWLKGNGIEKIYKLSTTSPSFPQNQPIFYMFFSRFPTFKQVLDQIRSQNEQNTFHIIVVPRFFPQFEQELEELGLLHSKVKLHSFQWLPFHLDTGILSLELPTIYKTLYLESDFINIPVLSKALWQLYFVTGRPNFIISLGQLSNMVLKQIDVLSQEKGETDVVNSDFGGLLVIDRSIDYPSVLLTPGIYSALLKEVYDVNCGICEHKTSDSGTSKLNPKVVKNQVSFNMDSTQDSIYSDIKNRYFTEVTAVLSTLTKQLKSDNVRNKDMGLEEMKKYVQTQLQAVKIKKKLITSHLLAAESIINEMGARYENQQEVEQNIMKNTAKQANLTYLHEVLCEDNKLVTLRLFCLLCFTQKLSDSEVKTFWRKFVQQHGFESSLALQYLANANFLPIEVQQSKIKLKFADKEFYTNANKFKQIPQNPEKINLKFPTCASYVFGGNYIPLVTQIASLLLNATPLDEITGKLESLGPLIMRNDKGYPLQPRSILVFVIGGISYAEIAACNLLENVTGAKIVLMSDRIVSGNDITADMLS